MMSERKLFSSPTNVQYERNHVGNACDPCAPKKKVVCETTRCVEQDMHQHSGYGNWWYLFWWFVIIAVIVWLILILTNPEIVQQCDDHGNPNGEVDQGKAILYAIVIAIIISIIVWLFTGYGYGY